MMPRLSIFSLLAVASGTDLFDDPNCRLNNTKKRIRRSISDHHSRFHHMRLYLGTLLFLPVTTVDCYLLGSVIGITRQQNKRNTSKKITTVVGEGFKRYNSCVTGDYNRESLARAAE